MVDLHEVGGLYKHQETYPGNGRSWFKANHPELILPAGLTEDGWWANRKRETRDEAIIRAKSVLEAIKGHAIQCTLREKSYKREQTTGKGKICLRRTMKQKTTLFTSATGPFWISNLGFFLTKNQTPVYFEIF
jgi:hypothetical protein